MRIDLTRVTVGGAWLIALAALALSDVAATGSHWALLFGLGVVPVVMLWMFSMAPDVRLAPSIAKARD